MVVLMRGATEAVASSDVQVGDLFGFGEVIR
jgi:hypothetical protein